MNIKEIKKITKIFHVSDIHIRMNKRHDEYRNVFQNLYNYIKENKDDESLVCILGDVLHSKVEISPESINETQLFIKSIADICPTLMILGNHDCLLNNSDRLDSLTPIVNSLNHPNLIYSKNTEIISLGDIDFYHWSVYSDKIDYIKPKNEKTSICLYHGLVNAAKNDSGYQMFSDYVKVSDFKGFDLVLLGDIHTHQYLNEEKTIAYASSLIQQNHGESVNGHGILVWDVMSGSSEFVEIANNTAYVTIDVENGVPTNLPDVWYENTYLRVRYKSTSQEDLKSVMRSIKEKTNVLEQSLTRVKATDIYDKQIKHSQGVDFRLLESQTKYITGYLEEVYDLPKSDIEEISEINKRINAKLIQKDSPRNTVWSPKRFDFENLFGYKGKNYIDFSNMEGTYGLFAPNASGKSTLLDSITYCLFDKCSKTSKANEVMNNSSDTFYCKFSFLLNDLEYCIERNGKKNKNGGVRVEVDFYYFNDLGEKISLNGKERTDTNANIRNIIGSYEDFILTSFSTQTGNASFIDIGQRERKDLLCQFMDLNVFEDLYSIANEDAKEIQYVLKDIEKKDWYSHKLEFENNLSKKEVDIEKIIEKRDAIKLDLENLDEKLTGINQKLQPVDKTLAGFDRNKADNTISSLNSEIEKIESEITKNISLFESENNTLSQYKSQLLKYDLENIQSKLQELSLCNSQLQKIELKLKKQVTIHEGNQQKMEKLKDLRYDENCKFCMDNVFVKDAIETKGKIKQEELEIENTNQEIETLKTTISSLKEYEEFKKSYDELEKLINTKSISALKIDNTIKDLNTKKEKRLVEVSSTLDLIERYVEQEKTIKENDAVYLEIESAKSIQKEYKSKYEKTSDEYTNEQVAKSVLENSIKECAIAIEKVADYQKKSKLYKHYLESIHRDGIPHMLISKTLPQIEEEVNSILSQLVDFKVILMSDSKNINGYIAYSNDRYWGIELVSGMEKFIASLAIRCALISVSSLPRPNFLWIDEGFGSLDKENLNSVVSLLEYLKTQFQFTAIISHIENMKDMVDEIIEISKVEGVSKIQYA
jgi:DNA repair exonuclease SbcCD ATPase subunit